MSNTFGSFFRVTTFGESHCAASGAVVDGCPAGMPFSEDRLNAYLADDPRYDSLRTARREPNRAKILSGTYKGLTLGTPIAMIVFTGDADASEYLRFEGVARPSHADYTYFKKYGLYDPRGGGRASGRECVGRHLAAAVASGLLEKAGIGFEANVIELAGIKTSNPRGLKKAVREAGRIKDCGDSTGGIFEIVVNGVPAGIGSPVFEKLDAAIAGCVFGIGGITGVEIGGGFQVAGMKGSEANDSFVADRRGKITTKTNYSGGIQGGISNGMPIIVRASVKPTPSIYLQQDTVDFYKCKNVKLELSGRYDANFTPRAMKAALSTLKILFADATIAAGIIHPDRFLP